METSNYQRTSNKGGAILGPAFVHILFIKSRHTIKYWTMQ